MAYWTNPETAPATKACGFVGCDKRINLAKRSSYIIDPRGALVCKSHLPEIHRELDQDGQHIETALAR